MEEENKRVFVSTMDKSPQRVEITGTRFIPRIGEEISFYNHSIYGLVKTIVHRENEVEIFVKRW